MTAHIVEFELFTEAELETLEFFPEELESIEAELYPNLESISPHKVAKDLEAYFEGDFEEVGLERRGGRGGGRRGRAGGRGGRGQQRPLQRQQRPPRSRGQNNTRPDISQFALKGPVSVKLLREVHGPEFNNCLRQAGWQEAKNAHILKRLKERGPSVGINTLADFAREVRQGKTGPNPGGGSRRFLNITTNKGKKPFVVFRNDKTPGTFITLTF